MISTKKGFFNTIRILIDLVEIEEDAKWNVMTRISQGNNVSFFAAFSLLDLNYGTI